MWKGVGWRKCWLEHALEKVKEELFPLGRQLLLHEQAYLSYFLKAEALLMQTSIFFLSPERGFFYSY